MPMLTLLLTGCLLVLVAILWLPVLSEILSVAGKRRTPPVGHANETTPRLLFLIPAHEEQLLITGCVRSLVHMDYPPPARRVLVIADNCTDDTAKLARQEGAEVLERFDRELPGKPRAIAWALSQIDLKAWDACVIVDADSVVAPSFATGLARLAPLNDIVFQSNIAVLNEFESWLTRLGGVLSRLRYEFTYPLKQSAGLNCPVMGNGMGFGTNLLMRDGWRAFSITEDSELYAIYTEAGIPIRHASLCDLYSQEVRSLEQGATQRRRWLAGRISVIRQWGVRLVRSPRISWHQKLDAFVELGLASPVLHFLAATGVASISLLAIRGPLGWWIAAAAAGSLSALILSTIMVFCRHPQPWRTLSALFMLPVYAAWRLVVVVRTVFTLRDTTWRKTARTAPLT
jgi:cellulose synthase/poly-beta-1,6-N-acetylglucosamine synthase-like glycosyltransferase